MPSRCCVYMCSNSADKNKDVSFHSFPNRDKSPNRYKTWLLKINRKSFTPGKTAKVCSQHFTEDDFDCSSVYKSKLLGFKTLTLLKKNAIPTIRLKGEGSPKKKAISSYQRKKIVKDALDDSACSSSFCDVGVVEYNDIAVEITNDIRESFEPYCNQEIQCELGTESYRKVLLTSEGSTEEESDGNDDDFIVSEDSDSSGNECNETEPLKRKNSNKTRRSCGAQIFFVVFDCLLQLLKFCLQCGSSVCDVQTTVKGVSLTVTTNCTKGHKNTWHSQPNINGRSSLNIRLATSMYLCGMSFSLFKEFSNILGLKSISNNTFYTIIKRYVVPEIKTFWLNERNLYFKNASEVRLAGDGQFDSPGYCAKYVTYTTMDIDSGKIVDFVVLQKGQVVGELEKPACETLLNRLLKHIKISLFVSDRHRGIRKMMRTQFGAIIHEFDVWHISKSLTKKLKAAGNEFELIKDWTASVINHLWWSSQTCEGNDEVLIEKFTSILKHITDTHSWTGGKYINCCSHGELSECERKQKKWIKKSKEEYNVISKIICDGKLLQDIRQTKNYCHTGKLESFHSVALKYKPKRNHFSYDGMVARTILSILDFNHNLYRPQTGRKMKYSKPLKRWVGVNTYKCKQHDWRYEILTSVIEAVHNNRSLQLEDDPYRATDVPKRITTLPRPQSVEEIRQFSRFHTVL